MSDNATAESVFRPGDIRDFLFAVHGYQPFPWQVELAAAGLRDDWPSAVDAPTGLGKTWAIDTAVLAMAAAGLGGDPTVFRRIFFVVDRRTVVDEAYDHARSLAKCLDSAAPGTVVYRVADGLRRLMGADGSSVAPLVTTRMRGGVTWDDRWVDRPDQPAIIVSTVDQVGSRLLFRGYGVGSRMRPIDAALTGTQSLMFLDEAHLSAPFATLLDAIKLSEPNPLVPGPRVVALSATPGGQQDVLEFDIAAHLADPVAHARLTSAKRLAVVSADSPAKQRKAMVASTQALLRGGAQRLLVTCNTVAEARDVHRDLAEAGVTAGLLTGRSRPVDRELVTEEWVRPLTPVGPPPEKPLVLVATQTVEVGVNIDVDALVTQECALDALIQRLGRVNRFGDRTGAAVVVARGAADRVYGAAAANTTHALEVAGAPLLASPQDSSLDGPGWLDVSPLALRKLAEELRALHRSSAREGELTREAARSPMFDGSLITGWAATSPAPSPDVPIEPYLHGLDRGEPTVMVAWRADLPPAPAQTSDTKASNASATPRRLALPINSSECLQLTRSAFRSWLAERPADDTDLEGVAVTDAVDDDLSVAITRDGSTVTNSRLSNVQSNDTILLRPSVGGLDNWGWAPRLSGPVLDVADLVVRRDTQRLRLQEATLFPLIFGPSADSNKLNQTAAAQWAAIKHARQTVESASRGDSDEDVRAAAIAFVGILRANLPEPSDPRVVAMLETYGSLDVSVDPLEILLRRPSADRAERRRTVDTSHADDESAEMSSMLGGQVGLDQHSQAVGELAHSYATNMGLPSDIVECVRQAGQHHDLGKLDDRFQSQLWGGYPPPTNPPPLAKSGVDPRSQRARRARAIACYPRGMRHEALSAALVERALELGHLRTAHPELLRHLIASHHGRGRPMTDTVDDRAPREVVWMAGADVVSTSSAINEDLTLPSRFVELNAKYGAWTLALLESLVRLADISCSREGS